MVQTPDADWLQVFDYIPIAMLVADAAGRIVYLNHDCAAMFGYTVDEGKVLTVEDLVPSHLRTDHAGYRRSFCEQPVRRTMGADRVVTGVRKDGADIPLEVGLGTITTSAGVRFVATILDISKQREHEAMLKRANTQLMQRNVELDEFVHVASHDLQEPIRKLISFSELLPGDLGREMPEKAAMDLKFIVDSAYRMHRLVQDLLKLSRAGNASLKIEPVDLNQCVAEVLGDLEDAIKARRALVNVPTLPEIRADRGLVTQLFQNLIANALKFVPAGTAPEVSITVEDRESGTVFGVRDNGIGIAPEFHDRVFAAFRRLHTRSEYDGSGIGLSICRKAVERLGGRIWVESSPGAGAHFRFTFGKVPGNHGC